MYIYIVRTAFHSMSSYYFFLLFFLFLLVLLIHIQDNHTNHYLVIIRLYLLFQLGQAQGCIWSCSWAPCTTLKALFHCLSKLHCFLMVGLGGIPRGPGKTFKTVNHPTFFFFFFIFQEDQITNS